MDDYRYLGDHSATPPWETRHMVCHTCRVEWGGCWDNFQCPICGEGELPTWTLSADFFFELRKKDTTKEGE